MDELSLSEALDILSGAVFPLIIAAIAFIIALVLRILLTVSVYKDCRELEAKNTVIWLIFVFLFPIAAIIYVLTRKYIERKTPKRCATCGADNPGEAKFCAACGSADLQHYEKPTAEAQTKRIRKAAIVLTVIYIVFALTSRVATSRAKHAVMEKAFEEYAAENIEDYEQYNGYKDYLWHEIKDFFEED